LSIDESLCRLSNDFMFSPVVQAQAAKRSRKVPEIRPGYTVRVHEKISEGGKERAQIFEGLVIMMHKGHYPTDVTFTVRRIASGVGVERIFALHSPVIQKIEVKKIAKVRRAKLTFLRQRSGKMARLSERFTESDEFAIAAAPVPTKEINEIKEDKDAEVTKGADKAVEAVKEDKKSEKS